MFSYKQINIIAAVGFVIMWSSGFIGARLGTAEASSMTVLMWRFIVAAAILGMWWVLVKRKKLSFKSILSQSLIGLLLKGAIFIVYFYRLNTGYLRVHLI